MEPSPAPPGKCAQVESAYATLRDRLLMLATAFTADWMADEERDMLLDAARKLSPDLRDALSLKIWGGLSFEEIGRLHGIAKSAAHDADKLGPGHRTFQRWRFVAEASCPELLPEFRRE